MPKKKIDRPYCSGTWTNAEFISFIKNQLRSATRKWRPVSETVRDARVRVGQYKCAGYKAGGHIVPVTRVVGGERVRNIHVDHVEPVVSPYVGFTTWDNFISNLFCEREGLQLLCSECHSLKTKDERAIATERRKNSVKE